MFRAPPNTNSANRTDPAPVEVAPQKTKHSNLQQHRITETEPN